ncbi:MAG: hypothetical protein ABI625_25180 [bacterium]
MSKTLSAAVVAAAVFLSACGSDAGTNPGNSQPVSLAQVFSELSLPGLSAAASVAGGVAIPSTNTLPSGCAYSAASQVFVCPPITTNGLTVTSSYALFNAAGTSLSAFDGATIASVRVKNTVAGTVNSDGNSYTIDVQQDQTLSGLQTNSHTLNGTSTANMTGSLKSAGSFTTHSAATITNLVIPANAVSGSYPSSGTITLDQTSAFGGGSTLTTHLVMTFNGTSKVAVTMTVGGISLSGCTIDLASATPSCS